MDLGRRNKVKIEGGMSSMTDLVFLLLIFFIIMSTMSRNTLPVDLPSNSESSPSKEDGPVEIGISENSLYFFDAENPENYTFDEVIPILDAKMEQETNKNLKISGDKTANYEAVFNIIALAKSREWKPVLTFEM
ncbi:MAG: biopolymer transporter ExbD [Crocinitomicaceae bacterium]|nr:biopolymer transporter ExbD [Crocinitomicaceae bacterium]